MTHAALPAQRGVIAGGLPLTGVGDHGFKIEHVRGHHVHVSTPEDASSARHGQSLWHFLPRALLRNIANAWTLEAQRLAKRGRRWWSADNELLRWTGLSLTLIVVFALCPPLWFRIVDPRVQAFRDGAGAGDAAPSSADGA